MKIGSLCTGYGGLDMAVEAYFNAKTVWCAEIDKHASKLIEQRFGYLNHGDLSKIDWASVERIDILTAGYPCQPFSVAGNRQGSNDARHLWTYIKQAISVLRPTYIVLENVRGHLSLGLKEVLSDLANAGYDARWQIIRASEVGAPHQRARLFIVAYTQSKGSRGQASAISGKSTQPRGDLSITTNPNGNAHTQSRRADTSVHGQTIQIIDRADRQVHRFSLEMDRQEVPAALDQDKLNPKFIEYMMGLPQGWVTDADISRTQQLKMLGNGVVPQQAYYAIQQLMELDTPSEQDLS
jgi:DNA (cytosine-5)-methyltransferase 1